MEFIRTIGLITINETLVVQAVSFLIFMFIMDRLMFRPLRATMAERNQEITGAQQEAEDTYERIGRLREEMFQYEAAVRLEAAKIRQDLEAEGNAQAQEIIAKALERIQEDRHAMNARIGEEIGKARQDMESESRTLSRWIMETILNRGLS